MTTTGDDTWLLYVRRDCPIIHPTAIETAIPSKTFSVGVTLLQFVECRLPDQALSFAERNDH
jgi:hypothetical protein